MTDHICPYYSHAISVSVQLVFFVCLFVIRFMQILLHEPHEENQNLNLVETQIPLNFESDLKVI